VVLLSGAAMGVVEGGRALVGSSTLRARVGARGVATGLVVAAIALVIALGSSAIDAIPYVKEQRDASVPTQLLDTFTRATRGQADDTVVLTDQEQLPEYLPVFVFNVWNAHYSNPAAQFDRRTSFLQRLAAERDPLVFAAALAHNRYDDVDSVALRRINDDLPYTFIDDAFPRGVTQRTITFRDAQFDRAYFAARGTAALAVYVPRGRDPLAALTAIQRRALDRRFAGDLDDAS